MRLIRNQFPLTTFILLLFIGVISSIHKQANAQENPETIGKDYFENMQFKQALPYFEDLVQLYPKDAMLNYYYAACLIEEKQFTQQTKTAIQNAFGTHSPAQIFYYQGQVFQADNDFLKAIGFYQRFIKEAKNKTVKNTRVNEFLELCKQGINPFLKAQEKKVSIPDSTEELTTTQPKEENEDIIKTKVFEIPKGLRDSLIHFQVTSTIFYLKLNQFKNDFSTESFVKGWIIELQLNELLAQINQLREKYGSASENEKEAIAEKIILLEKDTYSLNQQVQQFYFQAREKEVSFWDVAKPVEISKFRQALSILEDSISNSKERVPLQEVAQIIAIELPQDQETEIIDEDIQSSTSGIVYKIQIGAYRNSPPEWVQNLYKKLSIIRKIDNYTDEKGVTVYTVGELSSFKTALQMQAQVRQEGVKDAFVAAYKDGNRIPVKEARKLTE